MKLEELRNSSNGSGRSYKGWYEVYDETSLNEILNFKKNILLFESEFHYIPLNYIFT